MSSAFISKPPSGWIHPHKLISNEGATYSVKYVGCLEVKVSMKHLNFKTRSGVAKESINRVCEASGLKTDLKKRKVDKKVIAAIAEAPDMTYTGTNVSLNVSSSKLMLTSLDDHNMVIASHDMPHISFASGGDSDTMDFVAYIAKDPQEFRACYVLDCGGGLAKDVIATIGQAFELRYQQYIKPAQIGLAVGNPSTSSGGEADKDYYNDLPGKVPPDVGPPPVPPLPSGVPPFTNLPHVQTPKTPNLIDLSSDLTVLNSNPHHDYVNDTLKERDIFDMQPFTHQVSRHTEDHLMELQNEIWFHGRISRADAERLLQKDGDFLVRESPTTRGQFVLSGIQDDVKKHLLLIDPEGVIRTRDRMFNSISHLITYHCENVLPIISAESVLVLRHPVPRIM